MSIEQLLRIDACCDSMPRARARVEELGALRLFVGGSGSMPYYARPAGPSVTITTADVEQTRSRQRALGVPEAFEWIDDLVPSLGVAAQTSGLRVARCPLLVLEEGSRRDARVTILGAESPLLTQARAVAQLAFAPADANEPVGPAQRDIAARAIDPASLDGDRRAIRDGRFIVAVAIDGGGAVACGSVQHDGSVAEVVGVATLPTHRRRGLAGAITATLSAEARSRGMRTVFLSAGDEEAARVYERVGFRRIGTAGLAEPAV